MFRGYDQGMASSRLVIKLVRHGQSKANTEEIDPQFIGDFRTPLTALGEEQAREVGRQLGSEFFERSLVYVSPYERAQQTLREIMSVAAGSQPLAVYEDPRLREVDHGYSDVKDQAPLRERHGWFYYRYKDGESPADCYDRVSGFMESLMREVERKEAERVLLVTHGLALRCFVMRFLHLTVSEFERTENPGNADIVTIARRAAFVDTPSLEKGNWAVSGLKWQGQ